MRLPGFPADQPMSYFKIERAAKGLRQTLEIDLMKPVSGLEVFESLEKYRVRLPDGLFGLTPHVTTLPAGVEAEARFEAGEGDQGGEFCLCLTEDTYDWLESGERPRALFSVGHELGHVVLHAAQLRRLSRFPHSPSALRRARQPQHASYMDTEWQGNAFAAALLMPAPKLRQLEKAGRLDAITLSEDMGVSYEAAAYRLEAYLKRRELLAV